MAKKDEDKKPEQGEGGGGSNKKLLVLVALGALLIGGGGAGAAFWFVNAKADKAEVAAKEKVEQEKSEPKQAYYYEFKPPLIVTYQWHGRNHYLQAAVAVMSRNHDVIDLVREHMPAIKNNMHMFLAGQEFESMRTPEGKEAVRQGLFEEVQKVLKDAEASTEGIEQVYFMNFVMQ